MKSTTQEKSEDKFPREPETRARYLPPLPYFLFKNSRPRVFPVQFGSCFLNVGVDSSGAFLNRFQLGRGRLQFTQSDAIMKFVVIVEALLTRGMSSIDKAVRDDAFSLFFFRENVFPAK